MSKVPFPLAKKPSRRPARCSIAFHQRSKIVHCFLAILRAARAQNKPDAETIAARLDQARGACRFTSAMNDFISPQRTILHSTSGQEHRTLATAGLASTLLSIVDFPEFCCTLGEFQFLP